MSMRQRLLVTVAALACLARGARPQQVRREFAELHMGVAVRIELYAPDDPAARRAARAAYARIAEPEDIMSDYRPESEGRRLAERPRGPGPVGEALFPRLGRGLQPARQSDGAFDPTVGPFVALWRRARRTGRLPSRAELDSAAQRVGWRKVRADSAARSIRLDTAGMRLDLGGIAKGYILDQALLVLGRYGVTRALIQAGGDIVAGDPPPGLPGWRVDVPGARPLVRARAAALARAALSLSGDTEQFVIVGGVRYSHVVDPHTGVGLTSRRQAAVVAGDGLTAHRLSTPLTPLDDSGQDAALRSVPCVVAEVWRAR